MERTRITDFVFYIVVIFVAIVLWQTQIQMTSLARHQLESQGGVSGPVLTHLENLQERQLDAYLEVNRLLTTFGTALLGALGFLMFGQQRAAGTWSKHRWAAFLGVLFVTISIFFGYVAYLFIQSMLRDGAFDLTSSNPHWAQQAHFYTFLAGLIFFADFVFHNLSEGDRRENLPDVTGS